MKRVSTFLLVAFIFFIFITQIYALEIPPPSGNYVNDYASLLSAETKTRLETRLRKLGSETGTQIVVATFLSIEGESLEDFTNRMYEAWRIGQKSQNNGVLLAVFVQERKVRIEVGYGLEGALTDALSSQIIRNEFVPYFRAGQPEKGIENTVFAIEKAVRGEYTAEEKKPERFPPFLAILLILILIVVISRLNRTRGFTIGPVPRRGHYWDGGFFPGAGLPRSGGFGGYSSNDSDSGGGFGGFSGGGGLSGGGGAGGSW